MRYPCFSTTVQTQNNEQLAGSMASSFMPNSKLFGPVGNGLRNRSMGAAMKPLLTVR